MLRTRIITALILAPIAIGGIFFLPPLGFALFTGAIITVGAWEWANMAGITHPLGRVGYALALAAILFALFLTPPVPILAVALLWWVLALVMVVLYPRGRRTWRPAAFKALFGVLVLVPAWVGLNHLRSGDFQLAETGNNLLLILYTFCIVWVADIGAYFAGRAFGRAKLAPRVSPGKSWAGVWGGLAAVALLALFVAWAAGCSPAQALWLTAVSLVAGAFSVLGDLIESLFKRVRGIKDSSGLLPGHGGIMDRVDSLTAAIPIFALGITLMGWLEPAVLS
ncbi:phosphatidate cytidylyltransferase [Tamilnaduibacter salinus]|uniref:Phosphatidate cytidylyltransferase n=1 Tax=Tamilnaduibacter salinus TaxID=1484056 RepID=A0A2U1CT90_9GAMM|nr:phosphatidate cytidylyltransferase [Tamilnaduibacter salinus]PVY69789.1 phosphatidate cytidylyltransferase [Tamilnaduibacter salinus]